MDTETVVQFLIAHTLRKTSPHHGAVDTPGDSGLDAHLDQLYEQLYEMVTAALDGQPRLIERLVLDVQAMGRVDGVTSRRINRAVAKAVKRDAKFRKRLVALLAELDRAQRARRQLPVIPADSELDRDVPLPGSSPAYAEPLSHIRHIDVPFPERRGWRRMRRRPTAPLPPKYGSHENGWGGTNRDHIVKAPNPSGVRRSRLIEATTIVYPRIDGPGAVVVETVFEIRVGVSPKRDRTLAASTGGFEVPEVGAVTLGLLLTYDPDSLQPEGPLPETVTVDSGERVASVGARFRALDGDDLVPERRIGVHFLMDGVVVGIAWKRIFVVPDEAALSRVTPPGEDGLRLLELAPIVREGAPDLVIAVYQADTSARDRFVWAVYPAAADLRVPDTERSRSIGGDTKQFATDGRRTVHTATSAEALFADLHGRGLAIGRAIPQGVQHVLCQLVADHDRRNADPPTVLLLTEEVHIPWELAVFRAPANAASAPTTRLTSVAGGTSPFLGAHVAIGRWPLTKDRPPLVPPRSVEIRRTAVLSAQYEGSGKAALKYAQKEAEHILATYRPAVEVPPAFTDVMSLIRGEERVELVHVALHGQFDPDSNNEGLVLLRSKENASLGHEFLRPTHIETGTLPGAFVFLNACQVGAAKQVLGDYAGMAVAFLRAGAGAVVAPLWNVDDEKAGEVARAFYEAIFAAGGPPDADGPPAAEVLRRIRAGYTLEAATAAGESASGSVLATLAAYQLFGHPRFKLRRVAVD